MTASPFMTGRAHLAWLLDHLASTLPEVDEFLRSPEGYAALQAWYQSRGSIGPGFSAGNLIDSISFIVDDVRQQAAQHPQRPRRS
jgi:hypothetical protein